MRAELLAAWPNDQVNWCAATAARQVAAAYRRVRLNARLGMALRCAKYRVAGYFSRTSVKLAKGDSIPDLSTFLIVQDHVSVTRS